MSDMNTNSVEEIPVEFKKPPRRFLGFIFCKHSWKEYWKKIDESTSVGIQKCTRCLKEKV